MTNILFYDRHIGGVANPTVDAFAALEAALQDTGYQPTSRWAYNCRKISGTTRYSLHAYGIAIDIDPAENPYVSGGLDWSKTKFTPEQIAAVEAIETTQDVKVWTWGGQWVTKQDYMHFQINTTPAQLLAGIKETTMPDDYDPPSSWAAPSWAKAEALDPPVVTVDSDPHKTVTKEELVVMFDRLGLLED